MALTKEEQAQFDALSKKAGGSPGPNMDKLGPILYSLSEMSKGQQSQIDALKSQNGQIISLLEKGVSGAGTPKQDAVKVDDLSREELVAHTIAKVKAEFVEPLETKLNEGTQATRKNELVKQVETAAAAHGDFQNYTGEMKGILNANPNLHIEEAYQLARLQDPVKTAQVDKTMKEALDKAEKEKVGTEASKGGNVIEVEFGGMFPTNTLQSITGDEPPEDMTGDEAAQAAWKSSEMDAALAALTAK